jgi:hypothetical protein
MKKINLGILFFVFSTLMLLAYYGCKKDKNSNQIENSSGNIDMTINGIAWSPATLYASKSGEDMMVYGTNDNGKEFSIKLSSVSTGSFVIGEDNGGFFSDGQNYFRTGDLGTDTIVISAFDNNMIEGEFDLLLIKQGSERDTSGYVQLKGSFHVEQFFNNPYGWDRGKVSFYKTAESCDVMVRINMFNNGGGSNETPIAGPSPYLTFNFTEIPECEYGGYNLDMAPLNSRSGFDFRILPEGDYSIQIVTPDDNMNWTKIIAEDVVKIEKQKCILYEVKCDTEDNISVTTEPVSYIFHYMAVSGGVISYSGPDTANITSRGVCWSLTPNPSINDYKTNDGTGIGQYGSAISGLTPATTYYVRAYAESESIVYYGNQQSFQTTINNSIMNITIDGVDYIGKATLQFPFPYFIIYESNGEYVLGITGMDFTGTSPDIEYLDLYISHKNPINVGSYDFNKQCIEDHEYRNGEIFLLMSKNETFSDFQDWWYAQCPDYQHPHISYNGILSITALQEKMIQGSFNCIVVDQENPGEYPNFNFKNVSGSFTIYSDDLVPKSVNQKIENSFLNRMNKLHIRK